MKRFKGMGKNTGSKSGMKENEQGFKYRRHH